MTRATSRRELLLILGSLSAFGPWSIDMYLPGLPGLTKALHASATAGQLTLTGCLVGLAAGQVVAGPASDALGRRRPLVVGLAAYAAASLVCAAAPGVWTLVALRVVQGCAGGVGIVIARAVVRDLYGGVAAARTFAMLMMVTGVAPVVAPIVGGQVLRVTSWRGIFVVLAGIGAVLLAAAALRLPETLEPERRRSGGLVTSVHVFARLLVDRTFAPYAGAFALAFGAFFSYIAASSFVLENVYGLSPQVFSADFAANAVGLVTASQVSGRIVGRTGPGRLFAVGLFGMALGSAGVLAVVLMHAPLAPLLAAFFVMASSAGMSFPNATALALAEHREVAGSASALLGVGQFGTGAAVAPLVGIAGSHTATPLGVVAAAFAGLALVVYAAR